MYSYNDQAIILKRYPFGEADFLLVLFSKNHGKTKVVAKGVRRISSKRGGHLDLFNEVEVTVRESSGLGMVNEAKTLNAFSNAKESLVRLGYFYYLAEMIELLFPEEDKNYPVYRQLQKFLTQIDGIDGELSDQTIREIEDQVRKFEVFLLKEIGYWSDEVQGKIYPERMEERREFNQGMIREITSSDFNTSKVIRQLLLADFSANA